MTAGLFREEALRSFETPPWQPPLLSKPVSGFLLLAFVVAAAAAILGFAVSFEFVRKEEAHGHLTPALGWTQVAATSFGVVQRRLVEAGDQVEAGDVLFDLAPAEGLQRGLTVHAKLIQEVQEQRAVLESQDSLLQAQHENDLQRLEREHSLDEQELASLEQEIRFTGVALELSPTPAFAPRKKAETIPLSTFFSAFGGLGKPLVVTFAMTIGLQLFALLMPLSTQFVVDQGIRQGNMNIVVMLAVGFALVSAISALTDYFRSLLALYVGNTSAHRMVTGLAHHMIRLSDSWFSARHTGDVLSRFGSTAPIRRFLMTSAFALVLDAFLAVGALAIVIAYSWDMALVLLAFIAVFAALNLGTYRPLRNLTEESISAGARENSSFIENVERHRAIKLLGAEAVRENAWGERYVHSINAGARLARFGIHVGLAGGFIGVAENMVMLLLGAHKVILGEFTLGMWFAYSSYGAMLSGRLHAVINSLLGMRMLKLHQERVADIGLEPKEIDDQRAGVRAALKGRIEVKSLSFAYEGEESRVLDGLNLVVAPEEFVAVVGESGRGKSTLIKILCKLLAPTAGNVLVDGVDLRHLDTVRFRRQLGVVMQDDDLFSGSLVENIAVETERPDMERVAWAASLACIHEDIQRMPMQYMTLVGHMGSTLSGGQRQRVMIARAIYRKPRIFLLDEGTAHLNEELQRRVLLNLREQDATIIAATHDPRVIEQADRVVDLA